MCVGGGVHERKVRQGEERRGGERVRESKRGWGGLA